MSDKQDSLNDKQFSRSEFMKLMSAGTLSFVLGAYGVSNLKNMSHTSMCIEIMLYNFRIVNRCIGVFYQDELWFERHIASDIITTFKHETLLEYN